MSIKNKVQLIGNLGDAAKVTTLESGKKVANLTLATNEDYTNSKGDKVKSTGWHNLVAWGKTADIIEKYTSKGSKIAIEGKLVNRSYDTESGEKKYITEVQINEVLLLESKKEGNS